MYGDKVCDPVAVTVTQWASDEFSRGSYSYVAVGATGQEYDTLALPVSRCVLFAGEHTCKEHPDSVGGEAGSWGTPCHTHMHLAQGFVLPVGCVTPSASCVLLTACARLGLRLVYVPIEATRVLVVLLLLMLQVPCCLVCVRQLARCSCCGGRLVLMQLPWWRRAHKHSVRQTSANAWKVSQL